MTRDIRGPRRRIGSRRFTQNRIVLNGWVNCLFESVALTIELLRRGETYSVYFVDHGGNDSVAAALAPAAPAGSEQQGANMAKDEHNKAAEHHENAAKAHRSAAEHHGKGDHAKGKEQASAARQHSQTANQHSDQAHSKSQQQK